ncbi:MAG: oligosaccharide flippase family protein [Flavobacteriales bacterium]|nr:oligosaccharide flippase family protein [Flavobacteriales bacterium]
MLKQLTNDLKLKKFSIYGLGQVVNLVSPFLVFPYIIKICGEEGLGKIGVAMSLMFMLIVLVDYSSYIKGLRSISINRDNKVKIREIIATIYFSKLLLFLVVATVATIVFYTIPYLQSEFLLYFFSLVMVLAQAINPTWFYQGTEDFTKITLINIVSKIIYVVGVLFMVMDEVDYVWVNLIWGLGLFLPSVFFLIGLVIAYEIGLSDFKLNRALNLIKKDFTFCMSQLLLSLKQYSPIVIIDVLGGNVLSGQYKIIEQLIMPFRTFLQMLFRFSYSIIVRKIHTHLEKGYSIWKKINTLSVSFIVLSLVVVWLFSDFIFAYLNLQASDFERYAFLLLLALPIPVLIGVSLAQEQLLFSFDMNRVYEKITLWITVLALGLLFVGFYFFALKGIIVAQIIVELTLVGLYIWVLKNRKV